MIACLCIYTYLSFCFRIQEYAIFPQSNFTRKGWRQCLPSLGKLLNRYPCGKFLTYHTSSVTLKERSKLSVYPLMKAISNPRATKQKLMKWYDFYSKLPLLLFKTFLLDFFRIIEIYRYIYMF